MKGVFCLLIVLLVMRWGDADNEIFFSFFIAILSCLFFWVIRREAGRRGL